MLNVATPCTIRRSSTGCSPASGGGPNEQRGSPALGRPEGVTEGQPCPPERAEHPLSVAQKHRRKRGFVGSAIDSRRSIQLRSCLFAHLRGAPVKRGSELHTIEPSHGKARLTAPRPSDLGSVDAGDERQRNHRADGTFAPGNRAAYNRSAKRALTAPLRAARARLRDVVGGEGRPVADALLNDAMAVYGSARVELGKSSVFVLAPLASFATESVLAQHFTKLAAEAGFDTERGGQLLELAHRCETQAQRAMTAALAASKAVPQRRGQEDSTPWLVTSHERTKEKSE
jgi:hypothetical protein